jgi:hypothetical protein
VSVYPFVEAEGPAGVTSGGRPLLKVSRPASRQNQSGRSEREQHDVELIKQIQAVHEGAPRVRLGQGPVARPAGLAYQCCGQQRAPRVHRLVQRHPGCMATSAPTPPNTRKPAR